MASTALGDTEMLSSVFTGSDGATSGAAAILLSVSMPSLLLRLHGHRLPCSTAVGLLGSVIFDGCLDGVFGENRTVNLHGRKIQLIDDVHVLDGGRFFNGLSLEPFGGQGRRGDGGAAAKGLELRIFDHSSAD